MRTITGFLAAIVVLCGATSWAADAATGKSDGSVDSSRVSTVERNVRDAIAAELAGDNARRAELLSQALEQDPNCKSARWQAGFVKLDDTWLTPQAAGEKYSADSKLREYRQKRDQDAAAGLFTRGNTYSAATTGGRNARQGRVSSVENFSSSSLSPAGVKAHSDLAHWCRANQLSDEERAHWTQILLDDPSNSEAQARLGMRFYMGSLATHAQIDAAKKQHATEDKQLAEWKPTIVRLRTALNATNETERTDAAAEMAHMTDSAIIPALEWGIHSDASAGASLRSSPGHPATGAASAFQRQAISTLGRLAEQRATYSLAGLGVFGAQSEVRQLATEELKKRPLHAFVPTLLAGLANPIRFDYAMTFDRSEGTAAYRAVAAQEGRDMVKQVEYSSTAKGLLRNVTGGLTDGAGLFATNDPSSRGAAAQASRDNAGRNSLSGPRNWTQVPGALALARQSQIQEASFQNQNARIAQTNERINAVLECVCSIKPAGSSTDSANDGSDAIPDAAVAKSAPSTANYWWNWWADYTESQTTDKLVSITRYADDYTNYRNLYPQQTPRIMALGSASAECFAAGTPVVTLTGPIAIDKVQIGDRVLAQDAGTGELAYKPVLGTTLRPPTEMVLVTTSDGAVRATRGHPFWIVGKGWRMAKELSVGDRVHGLHGAATVTALERQPAEPAYNLIVADFATYFVGAGQILAHDSTARLPTIVAVPGMGGQSR